VRTLASCGQKLSVKKYVRKHARWNNAPLLW
jgi:hypothetical protein